MRTHAHTPGWRFKSDLGKALSFPLSSHPGGGGISFVPHISLELHLPLLRTPVSLNPSHPSKRNPRTAEGRPSVSHAQRPLAHVTRRDDGCQGDDTSVTGYGKARGQRVSAMAGGQACGSALRNLHQAPAAAVYLNSVPAEAAGHQAHPYVDEHWLCQCWVRQFPRQHFWSQKHQICKGILATWGCAFLRPHKFDLWWWFGLLLFSLKYLANCPLTEVERGKAVNEAERLKKIKKSV